MSRRATSNKLNTSFGSSSINNNSPTVISAIRQLKQDSQMLLREHKRYRVLNHQISREHIRSINKEKQQSFFTAVKQSAHHDKQVKKAHEQRKIEQVKKRFSLNLKLREQNKQMIQNVRKSFNNTNHETYEKIRQKREENQNMVRSRRSFVLQSRVMNRKKIEEEEKIRRKSIQNFYNSRIQTYRQSKEEEIKDLLRKSEEKRKFQEAMSSRNSRIRDNKLDLSRSLSNRSLNNPESARPS